MFSISLFEQFNVSLMNETFHLFKKIITGPITGNTKILLAPNL